MNKPAYAERQRQRRDPKWQKGHLARHMKAGARAWRHRRRELAEPTLADELRPD